MVDLVALSGLVEAVEPERLGSTLAADTAAAETVLTVASTEPFETESGTGRVLIGGMAYDQIAVDTDASTITIDPGLTGDAEQDIEVNVSPLTSIVIAKVSTAAGDVISARVATAHIPYLRIGDREPDEREAVTLYREGQGYVTLDVPNGTAVSDVDGLPQIPAEAVSGGGGLDGGNDDDGFVLPTLSSWVPDGDPDLWVQAAHVSGGRIYTQDEVWENFDSPTFVWAEFAAGDMFYEFEPFVFATLELQEQTFFPAWSMPLVGQAMKVTVDDITTTGVTTEFWNDGVQFNLFFGSFSDNPVTGKYYFHEDQVHYEDVWNNTTHAKELYRREWADSSGGSGIDALPMSSSTETLNDPHVKGVLVFFPSNWTTYPGPYAGDPIIETATLTNVHMEQV